jgi:hypothetical protein
VLFGINAKPGKAVEIQLLDVVRRRFEHDLILIVVLHAVWIFAVAAVRRSTTRLRVGRTPGLRTERSQKGGGMEGAGPHLQVIGLLDYASIVGPKPVECEDKFLEGHEAVQPSFRGV